MATKRQCQACACALCRPSTDSPHLQSAFAPSTARSDHLCPDSPAITLDDLQRSFISLWTQGDDWPRLRERSVKCWPINLPSSSDQRTPRPCSSDRPSSPSSAHGRVFFDGSNSLKLLVWLRSTGKQQARRRPCSFRLGTHPTRRKATVRQPVLRAYPHATCTPPPISFPPAPSALLPAAAADVRAAPRPLPSSASPAVSPSPSALFPFPASLSARIPLEHVPSTLDRVAVQRPLPAATDAAATSDAVRQQARSDPDAPFQRTVQRPRTRLAEVAVVRPSAFAHALLSRGCSSPLGLAGQALPRPGILELNGLNHPHFLSRLLRSCLSRHMLLLPPCSFGFGGKRSESSKGKGTAKKRGNSDDATFPLSPSPLP